MKKFLSILSKIVFFITILVIVLFILCKFFRCGFACKTFGVVGLSVDRRKTSVALNPDLDPSKNYNRLADLLEKGSSFIVLKSPDNVSQYMTLVLPTEDSVGDYVLTWQQGNILQWKDITSIDGIGDVIQMIINNTDFSQYFASGSSTNVIQCDTSPCVAQESLVKDIDFNDINIYGALPLKNGGTGSAKSILDTINGSNFDITSKNINIMEGGIINAHDSDIYVSGNWACAGTLNPYTSRVYLNGTGEQHVSGSTTFYDFVVKTYTPKTVVFDQDAMVYIVDGGTITLKGDAGNILTAKSSSDAPWYLRLYPNANTDLEYLNVSHSNAGGYKTIIATNGTITDGGMNINWRFVEPSPYIMTNFEKVDLSGVDINK